MMDKYQLLRDNLPELIAEASRQGGVNRRAQLVIDLLEERDQIMAALRIAAEQPKAFKELPMCSSPLTVIATRATPDDERDYGLEDGGERSRNILAARPRKLT